MILPGQTIDRDTLNGAFISKTATGTQIAAGSLYLLGNFQVGGTTTLSTTTTGALTITGALSAGANSITTTGTITAGTFSGSGASLTSLNGTNISSGTVADARLSTNVMLLNGTQTITGAKTMNASLYFANGSTYYVDSSANAKFNSVTNSGTFTSNIASGGVLLKHTIAEGDSWIFQESSSSWGMVYHNNGTGNQLTLGDYTTQGMEIMGAAGNNYANTLQMNPSSFTGTPNSYATWALSLSGNIWAANNIQSMSTLIGNNLDIRSQIKHSIYNEFPDPLLASNNVSMWSVTRGTVATNIQVPPTIQANYSMKLSASQSDAYAIYPYHFPVNPNDWITYSVYGYAGQSNVSADVYLLFFDANNNQIAVPSWSGGLATSWTRYSVTAQAPSAASYFKVRVDNNSGSTTYAVGAMADADATANTGSIPTLSNGTGWTATDTITFVIGTGPVISSITGTAGITYTAVRDATTTTTYHVSGSNGSTFDLSIIGGVANDNWKFTVTQSVVTIDTYWSGFQVERGRAMSGFMPYAGGKDVSLYYDGTNPTLYGNGILNIKTSSNTTNISGNLGLNMSSPAAKLHINNGQASASTTYEMVLQSGSDGTNTRHGIEFRGSANTEARITTGNFGTWNGGLIFETRVAAVSGTTTSEAMRIHSNGYVGVNQSSPSERLDVVGNIKTSANLIAGGTLSVTGASTLSGTTTLGGNLILNGTYLQLNVPSSGSWARGAGIYSNDGATMYGGTGLYGTGSTVTNAYLAHGVSPWLSGTGIYILPSGYTGVGILTPLSKLHVGTGGNSSTAILENTATWNIQAVNTSAGGSTFYLGVSATAWSSSAGSFHISRSATASAADFTINSSGNTGLGTTSPAEKLHVNGNIQTTNAQVNGFIKFSSSWTDIVNNSTWYGLGWSNLLDASTAGHNLIQLAGYWGLNFKTMTNELRIPMNGVVTLNNNRILTVADYGSGNGINADQVDGVHASGLVSSTVYREKFIIPTGGYSSGTAVTIPNSRTYILGSNRLQVFRDGWLMEPTDDYTEATTSTVTFAYALPAGTKITFVIINAAG